MVKAVIIILIIKTKSALMIMRPLLINLLLMKDLINFAVFAIALIIYAQSSIIASICAFARIFHASSASFLTSTVSFLFIAIIIINYPI